MDLDIRLDPRVLGVALAATVLTAVLVSLLPAVQVFHILPGSLLKDGGGAVRRRAGQVLVVAQVGASVVLLSSAAIVFGAFDRILAAQDGVHPGGLSLAMLDVGAAIQDTSRQSAFYDAVLARAASDPGLSGVALTATIPPFQWAGAVTIFRSGEEPPAEALVGRELELGYRVRAVRVSTGFFEVIGVPLIRGRTFTGADDVRAEWVAIVSRRLAAELWPGQDPVGQFVSWPVAAGPSRPPLRVVGVAEDTRDLPLAEDPPLTMYVPFSQHPRANLILAVRSRDGSAASPDALEAMVADVDPSVPVLGANTLLQRLHDEMRPQRTASIWVGVFGVIALFLASIGLYGTVAQQVLQRLRELAVRRALGASSGGILIEVVRDAMRLVGIGAVVGALGTLGGFKVLRSLFSGVQIVDLRYSGLAAVVLALAAAAATSLPARRASRTSLVDTLRCD